MDTLNIGLWCDFHVVVRI